MSGELKTIHAELQELSGVVKYRDKTIAEYTNRVRMLFIRAHRDVPRAEQKRILVSNFTRELFDKKLAFHLRTVNPISTSKAKNVATTGDAMIAEQKARQRH